jgi:DNA processing protein
MTPTRLAKLLDHCPDPESVLADLGEEGASALVAGASVVARRRTRVFLAHEPEFPITDDLPGRPAVLLAEGDRPEALDAPRVAIVGTRAATPHGLADARALGAFLADHGVSVVSGLAIGIDGAAHSGAVEATRPDLRAGPIGVVATGLDVVYPRRHLTLFHQVRERGLLISECPYGTQPAPGRFPVRNRIIAGLADLVVVVEATIHGGSRITAERALDYGRPVFAMPGSRRNPSAAGCNALLADGALPLLEPSDILLALGLTPGARRGWEERPARRHSLSRDAQRLETALGGEPAHPDDLAARTGLAPDQLSLALEELLAAGRIERSRGFVWPV